MKQIRFLCLIMTLALLLSACGGAASNEAAPMDGADFAVKEDYGYAAEAPEYSLTTDSATGQTPLNTGRKLIKTVRLNAETEHYDELMTGLTDRIASLGGYVENRESRGQRSRYCSMTVRIPAEQLDGFVDFVSENANVTHSSETAEDITLQYVDTEAKIKALETEQTRLLELLENAQTLSEILEIEARLSDVTYELERYSSQKRSYDNLVDYATVHLSVSEVEVLTPTEEPTVWQRIANGFTASLDDVGTGFVDLFVWVTANSPRLAVWGAVIAGIVFIVRRAFRAKGRKKAAPADAPRDTSET